MERTHPLDVVLRRRSPPSPVGSPRSVPSRRGRPRRSHRRGRQAPALRPRSLALDVRLLHRGPPPLRGRGLPPHRRRPRRARASPPADPARRRAAAPDGHREAGPAPDPGEPGGHPRARRPPVEARDRGARGGACAPSRCSGGDAEAARPTGGDDVAGPPPRPGRRGALSRTASGARGFASMRRTRVRTELRRPSVELRPNPERRRCLPAFSPRPGPRRSSPSPRLATRSSSPPPPSSTTSSSGCGPSCAPRCPTATWLRSSSRPSPRSSRGSKHGASPGPRRRGRRSRRAETSPTTRQIPAAVKRAVYERDGGRCRYEDEQGRRCTARQGLEFHHRRPFGHGGDHSVENVSLACKCHNGYLAEVDYGREAMARHRRAGTRPLEPTPSPSP